MVERWELAVFIMLKAQALAARSEPRPRANPVAYVAVTKFAPQQRL